MQYRVKGAYSYFTIDTDEGMVFMINTKLVKKEMVEYETRFKSFTHIKEAYEYLSQTERMPVWKLRTRTVAMEAQK